jgi:hypothetical protein
MDGLHGQTNQTGLLSQASQADQDSHLANRLRPDRHTLGKAQTDIIFQITSPRKLARASQAAEAAGKSRHASRGSKVDLQTRTNIHSRPPSQLQTAITQLETHLNRVRNSAFKILNHMRKDVKESVKITCCSKQTFLKYYKELWTETTHEETERGTDNEDEQEITLEELELALKKIKYGKSPGVDQIYSEL